MQFFGKVDLFHLMNLNYKARIYVVSLESSWLLGKEVVFWI